MRSREDDWKLFKKRFKFTEYINEHFNWNLLFCDSNKLRWVHNDTFDDLTLGLGLLFTLQVSTGTGVQASSQEYLNFKLII